MAIRPSAISLRIVRSERTTAAILGLSRARVASDSPGVPERLRRPRPALVEHEPGRELWIRAPGGVDGERVPSNAGADPVADHLAVELERRGRPARLLGPDSRREQRPVRDPDRRQL